MIAALSLCLFLLGPIDSAQEAFSEGNRLYLQGAFAEAHQLYAIGLDLEERPGLFHFNLGNSLYQSGRLGPALYHYLMARQHLGRDVAVQRNIATVRARLGFDGAPDLGPIRNLQDRLSTYQPSDFLCVAAFLCCPALLLFAYARARKSRVARRLGLGWAGLAALHFLLAVVLATGFECPRGVALASCEVLEHPGAAESESLFQLREGEGVILEEGKNRWYRILCEDGTSGWVSSDTVRPLR